MGYYILFIIVGAIIVYFVYKEHLQSISFDNKTSQGINSQNVNPMINNKDAVVDSGFTEFVSKEMHVLSTQIGLLATEAYMIYSYTFDAEHIFEKLKTILKYIDIKGRHFECHFDKSSNTSGVIFFDDIQTYYQYTLITNQKYNCDAVIILGLPIRGDETNEEWQKFLELMISFRKCYLSNLNIVNCTVENIEIAQKTASLQNNGFRFSTDNLGRIFKTADVLPLKDNDLNEYVVHNESCFDENLITPYKISGQCTLYDLQKSKLYQELGTLKNNMGDHRFNMSSRFLSMLMPDAIEEFAELHKDSFDSELLFAFICSCFNQPEYQRKYSQYYVKYGQDDTKIITLAREELFNWICANNDSNPSCPKDARANIICAFAEYSAVGVYFEALSDEVKDRIIHDINALLYSVLYYEKCGATFLSQIGNEEYDQTYIWNHMATVSYMENFITSFLVPGSE